MPRFISVIIPNYNNSATIGRCLEAVFASAYDNFEVVVIDDCSVDDSVDIIEGFPCKLVRLDRHAGASTARNAGAARSRGDILFLTDADCLLTRDALAIAAETLSSYGPGVILGGTYTPIPGDDGFFSTFQSIFINYSETKRAERPDYVATHAMIIDAATFRKSGGFVEDFLPILEDVEFCHRMCRAGYALRVNPDIQVRHIFGFSLSRSLRNAFRKSMFWTIYSIRNGDLLADSGASSHELKANGGACLLSVLLLALFLWVPHPAIPPLIFLTVAVNLFISRRLMSAFLRHKGARFAAAAVIYYVSLYPLAAGAGALAGAVRHLTVVRENR